MSSKFDSKNSELIAKRWASALLDLTKEDEGISKEDVLDDLIEVSDNIKSSEQLSEVLNNPSISIEEKQIVLSKLFQTKLMPISFRFLSVLNSKNRLQMLSSIANEFDKMLSNLKNILKVEITSAIELNGEKKEEIKNNLAKKLNKDIVPTWYVNSDIIGGLVFNINETIINNSIKYKLEKLSNNIIKG